MTRDEIDAKLTDQVLKAMIRQSSFADMRAVLSSALQGEPERGKTWQVIDRLNLPECPCLVTNNINARDAFGRMSHIWLAKVMLHVSADTGQVYCFNDSDTRIWSLTHYMPVPLPDPPPPTTEGDRP